MKNRNRNYANCTGCNDNCIINIGGYQPKSNCRKQWHHGKSDEGSGYV